MWWLAGPAMASSWLDWVAMAGLVFLLPVAAPCGAVLPALLSLSRCGA